MTDDTLEPLASVNVEEHVQEAAGTTAGNLVTVLIHNDEVTPYAYVMYLLGDIFMLSEELADHIAWTAHTKGTAVVVVRPRAEAEKLVKVARGRARMDGYPLTFTLEQDR